MQVHISHRRNVFSSTPFGGNQLAVLPDATGISTEGMQKIAREFNFPESTFVLPKNDSANTYRVRIFTPRAELDFAGHPTIGTACALVMKQHVQTADPILDWFWRRNVGPVMVDVAQRNRGYHGTLTLSGKDQSTDRRTHSSRDLAAVLSIGPRRGGVNPFFAGIGLPFCFAQLKSNEVVSRSGGRRSCRLDSNAVASMVVQPLFLRRRSTRRRQPLCSHVRTRAGHRRGSRDRQRLCRPRRRHGIEA